MGFLYVPFREGCTRADFAAILLKFVNSMHEGEFGWTTVFDPVLIDECCSLGIFPMAILPAEEDVSISFFALKLHLNRNVLNLSTWSPPIHKSDRKRAKKYRISINTNFALILSQLHRQHGENWLCAPIRRAFLYLANNPDRFNTKFLSVEVWSRQTNELVAFEFGTCVADIYASFSGGSNASGTGRLQLLCLGTMLKQCGFKYWDFGMSMEYKVELGSEDIPREQWINLVKERSSIGASPYANLLPMAADCATLLQPPPPAPPTPEELLALQV